ncbi:MAG: hypothetical protein ACRDL7_01215, partial [Gaiellaceae bacterium]
MEQVFNEKLELLGLTDNQRLAFVTQGIPDMASFALFDTPALDDLFKTRQLLGVTSMIKLRLRGLCEWYNEVNEGLSEDGQPNLQEVTMDIITDQLKKMKKREKGTSAQKASHSTKETQKLPPDFSGKQKDWLAFSRAFRAYLGSMTNPNGVPMTYVIRTAADENADNDEDGRIGVLIGKAPLRGDVYDMDNYKVFQLLTGFLLKGTGFVQIESFKADGRGAWQALMVIYQGKDARNAIVAAADKTINDTKYTGEKRNFKFEDFTAKFLHAYQQKKIFGEEVSGSKQVRDFVSGIHHDKMSNLAATILGNETYNSDLQKAAAHLADVARVQGILSGSNTDDNRKISAVSLTGRGRGRGRGRGARRGGRRGRGRGRGERGGGQYKHHNNDDNDHDYIPKAVLDGLDPVHRKWLFEGRDHMRGKRNVSALESHTDVDEENEVAESSASSQFGREGRDRSLQDNKKARSQKAIQSTTRRIKGTTTTRFDDSTDLTLRARLECDSCADTVCAGATFKLIEMSGHVCDVSGFHQSFATMNDVPIATTATAYD